MQRTQSQDTSDTHLSVDTLEVLSRTRRTDRQIESCALSSCHAPARGSSSLWGLWVRRLRIAAVQGESLGTSRVGAPLANNER